MRTKEMLVFKLGAHSDDERVMLALLSELDKAYTASSRRSSSTRAPTCSRRR